MWLFGNGHSVEYWNMRNRIMYSPPGETQGGGGGDDTTAGTEGDDTLEGGNQTQNAGGNPNDELINLDGLNLLNEMFKVEDGADDDDPESLKTPADILDAKTMGEQLEAGFQGIRLPSDFLPEDFNPADRKQMSGLFQKAIELGARHALNLSFKPVENALKMHAHRTKVDLSTRIKDSSNLSSEEKFLEREIPAYLNPTVSQLVKGAFTQGKTRFPNDRAKAAAFAKKGLAAMGVDVNDSGVPNQGGRGGSGGVKTGKDALDMFAPVKTNTGPNRTGDAIRRS